MKKVTKKTARFGAAFLAVAFAMSGMGSLSTVHAEKSMSVKTESQTQMSSDPEVVYLNQYHDTTVRTQNFDSNWKFYLGEAGGAEKASFDDSKWRNLSLPHDYSIEQEFSKSMEAESGYLPGGTGWYRKHFELGTEMQGKEIRIDFGGVYMNSTVWVNGEKLGTHPYGYTPFSYDITDYVKLGEENVISVKVDHKTPSSRWYSGSGIYRSVNLTVMDPVHVDLYGTKIETPDLAGNQSAVNTNIRTTVKNESEAAKNISLTHTIFEKGTDAASNIGTVTTKAQSVEAGKSADIEATVVANSPKLWSTTSPSLYTVRTEVKVEDQVVDTYDTDYGFRYFNFDANNGFSLNGENVKLKGVCMHHDQGSLGAVANRRAMERQVEILKEMGCNSIRVTHNPASDELLEICNEQGILVVEEAFDTWLAEKNYNSHDYAKWYGKAIEDGNAILGKEEGMTWAQFDLNAMIKRGQNDPSIIMWSLGNEVMEGITIGTGGYPAAAEQLITWAQEVDTTRPVTTGDNKIKGNKSESIQIADSLNAANGLVGYNYASGDQLDKAHKAHPEWKIYGSETASSVNSRGIYNRTTDNNKTSDKQLTSYDGSKVPWGAYASDAWYTTITRDFVAGEYVWTGFDYIGEPTHWNGVTAGAQGAWESPKNSYFGIIDTAGFPKDSYYLYQSQWNDNLNTLHILPAWNEEVVAKDRNGNVPVVVYSDAAKVELFFTPADGGEKRSLGAKEFTKHTTTAGYTYQLYEGEGKSNEAHKNLYLTWQVPYEDGTIEAVAYDEKGQVLKDTDGRSSVTTTGKAAKLSAKVDRKTIKADGKDLSYITVDVTDKDGNIVPDAANRIKFEVKGEGTLVGVDNGNSPDHDSYKGKERNAFGGKALAIVQSSKKAGNITVEMTGKGLKGQTVTISTEKVNEDVTEEKILDSFYMAKHYYVKVGNKPSLPDKIEARYQDGTVEQKAVVWNEISESQYTAQGSFTVEGTIDGLYKVAVTVNMIDKIGGILNYSTTTALGREPVLPETRQAVLSNGEILDAAFTVHWDRPDPEVYKKEGMVTVNGTSNVLGQEIDVIASVRVQKEKVEIGTSVSGKASVLEQDIPQDMQSDTLKAIVDGSTEIADNIGGAANPTAWSNWKNSNRGNDNTASITFGYDTQQSFGEIVIYFWRDSGSARYPDPGSTKIYASDSKDGSYTEVVAEEQIGKENGRVKAYTYKLTEPLLATYLRFDLTNSTEPTGTSQKACTGITEIELKTATKSFTANSNAKLSSLVVNDEKVSKSALEAGSYATPALFAEVAAESKDNAAITVLPQYNNEIKIITESEDHSKRETFVIQLDKEGEVLPSDDGLDYPVEKITATADSEYTPGSSEEGPVRYVLDGKYNTHWHTNWRTSEATDVNKRRVTLELEEEATIDALRYYPRANGKNGRVKTYKVEYSTDGQDWKTISEGEWNTDTTDWMMAEFTEPVKAKFVRLTGVNTVSDNGPNKHMAVSELRLRTVKAQTDLADAEAVTVEPIEKQMVDLVDAEHPVQPKVTLKLADGTALRYGIDFKLKYENNTAEGNAKAIATGIGKYKGSVEIPFVIEKNPVTLETISVTTTPKTSYNKGETFDPSGLVLTLSYSDHSAKQVAYGEDTKDAFQFNPSLDTKLKDTMNVVIVTYEGQSAEIKITVNSTPVDPDTKPEEKPDVKPDEKPDVKPDEKPDVKPDEKPDVKPEEKPEVKPEVKPGETPDANPEVKPDNKPGTNPEAKPDSTSKTEGNVSGAARTGDQSMIFTIGGVFLISAAVLAGIILKKRRYS